MHDDATRDVPLLKSLRCDPSFSACPKLDDSRSLRKERHNSGINSCFAFDAIVAHFKKSPFSGVLWAPIRAVCPVLSCGRYLQVYAPISP
jgi:hypothetical protein